VLLIVVPGTGTTVGPYNRLHPLLKNCQNQITGPKQKGSLLMENKTGLSSYR